MGSNWGIEASRSSRELAVWGAGRGRGDGRRRGLRAGGFAVALVLAVGCSGSEPDPHAGSDDERLAEEVAETLSSLPLPPGFPMPDLRGPGDGGDGEIADADADEDGDGDGEGFAAIDEAVDSGVWFASCADAVIAGAAPLREGDAGYRPGLDPDGDGVGCERSSTAQQREGQR